MEHDAGIDVALERSSVCVVDGGGKIVAEAKVTSEPEALVAWLQAQPFDLARIGLEAGPLSQWLFAGLRDAGFAAELLETRHVRAAFKTMPVKTDKKDARGIAQLMRLAPPWSADHGRFADGSRGLPRVPTPRAAWGGSARDGSSRCTASRWRRRRPGHC
jgi:transposase